MKKALFLSFFLLLTPRFCLAAASVLGNLTQDRIAQQGERYEGVIILIYSVSGHRDPGISDRDTFAVVVLPVTKLEMSVESKPDMLIAGESYQAVARLFNKGNTSQKITLQLKATPDYPAGIEPSEMVLEAGESREIRIQVKTDEKLNQKAAHFCLLRAETSDAQNNPVFTDLNISVEIIPRVTGEIDPYHRLPASLALVGVSADGRSGGQIDFFGAGNLDEAGNHTIEFRFRGPDIQNKSIFGLRDEYRLAYSQPRFALRLGDWGYSLSPLTELYEYGRGIISARSACKLMQSDGYWKITSPEIGMRISKDIRYTHGSDLPPGRLMASTSGWAICPTAVRPIR